MSPQSTQLICSLGSQRIAIGAQAVERIVRAVEVLPLPGTRPTILGVIDVAGQLVPVFSPRRLLGLEQPEINPAHMFVLVRASNRLVALVMDAVLDLAALMPEPNPCPHDVELPPFVRGVCPGPDGLVLVQDVDAFLTPEEYAELDAAMAARKEMDHAPGAL